MAKTAPQSIEDYELEFSQISDISVETLGLVDHGANREEFFLRKRKEAACRMLLTCSERTRNSTL
jgi:hypothetical protein